MTRYTETRALTGAELEEVSGGLDPQLVGVALGSGATMLGFGVVFVFAHVLPKGNLCDALNPLFSDGTAPGCPQ